ncbi:heparinase II/III domain-containing protein [Krasilnikoviella flava]|uniref:Heparinase II/III-like protein n=1 Tax=Krasilnikoviella flava TaxID=526729 RepID=A0A1T5LYZ0_9MICO|nr:heparinase II/III family protein [Krasilnikoviella flava]SKC81085.1 Heparinase II/III-like protein [Krasilnikoviella flava]
MTPRPVVPDWAAARRRTHDAPWAAAVLDAVRVDHDHWRDRLAVPPPGADSAWTHHYFCGDDGAPLRFDAGSPRRHRCPTCGREHSGEPWDGAWRTRMHGAAAAQAQRAALLARLSDDPAEAREAAAGLAGILTAYARDYSSYAPHGVNVGTGRVQPQNLDEAVWAVGLLRAARWAGDTLGPEVHAATTRLAGEVAALLRPQLGMIHNIHCWLLAALAECAVRTGDATLLAECRDGEFGAEAQAREGFGPEGLWFEVNPHYHYYTVTALLSYAEATGPGGLSDEAAARLARAVRAPVALAYDDGRIPAYADGWPDCFVGTFAEQAEAATALLPGNPVPLAPFYAQPRTAPVQLWFANQHTHGPSAPLTGRGSVAALVLGPDDVAAVPAPPLGSFVWPHAGIGVLRSDDVRLAMRFGPPSGWHDHHDRLAVDVGTAGGWSSLDLGTSGYGAEITDWMRSPVAHDLVILDGLPQPDLAGRLVEAGDDRLVAEASWGPGRVRRALALEPAGWSDVTTVTAPEGTVVEWVFHGDGRVRADGAAPAGLLAPPRDDLGHRWLREVHRVPPGTDGEVRLRWDAPGSPTLTLPLPPGGTVETAVADANPTGLPLGVVRVRGVVPADGLLEVAASFAIGG